MRLAITILFTGISCAFAVEQDYFRQILNRYEELSGKHVEMIDDIDRHAFHITIDIENDDLTTEYIRETLLKGNIGLFEIGTNRLIATWAEPNIAMARKHLNYYKETHQNPPIGLFGYNEVKLYQAKNPQLKKMREQFEELNSAQKSIAMHDIEYKNEVDEFHSSTYSIERYNMHIKRMRVITERLKRNDEKYRVAKQKRDNSLISLNIRTLELIINDYEKRGKCVPTRWMKGHRNNLKGTDIVLD